MTKNTSSPDKSSKHGTKKSSSSNECRLQYDDRKYVDRGRLFMLQINKEIMTHGLEKMNCGKVGRPFTFSNACVAAAVLFRNAIGIPYRQLEGVTEAIVGKENAPTYSAFQKRMTKLNCTVDDNGSGNTAAAWFTDGKTRTEISLFAFDSTGLKPTNRGDWMAEKWGVRRGFIKLHIGVDAKTKKIYAAVITDDKCGDSPQFEELVGQAFANAEKSPNVETSADTKVAADGAYDTRDIYNYCNKYEIEPLIPVRINFAGNANGCMSRKKAGFEQLGSFEHIDKKAEHEFAGLTRKEKKERQNAWRKESGYNDRWTVETAFSTFKRVLGESISAQKWENVKTEIYGKIRLYNQMIDTAIESGYGTPKMVYQSKTRHKDRGVGGKAMT